MKRVRPEEFGFLRESTSKRLDGAYQFPQLAVAVVSGVKLWPGVHNNLTDSTEVCPTLIIIALLNALADGVEEAGVLLERAGHWTF